MQISHSQMKKPKNLSTYFFLSILMQRCTCLSLLKCRGISTQTAIPGNGNLKKYYCQILMQSSNKTISHEMKGIVSHITIASPLQTKQMQPNFGRNLHIVSFLTLSMSYLIERLRQGSVFFLCSAA